MPRVVLDATNGYHQWMPQMDATKYGSVFLGGAEAGGREEAAGRQRTKTDQNRRAEGWTKDTPCRIDDGCHGRRQDSRRL